MGSRETCPACRAHTSNVYFAFQRGEDCPHCGLDADTAAAVLNVQRRHADSEMLERYNDVTPPPRERGGFSLALAGFATDQPGP